MAVTLAAISIYLALQGELSLRDRWNPSLTYQFKGISLYCLSLAIFLLGIFAGAVAYGWGTGKIPMPDNTSVRMHPEYQGNLMLKFALILGPVIPLLLLAFYAAEVIPTSH